MRSKNEIVRQYMARLINAFASLSEGKCSTASTLGLTSLCLCNIRACLTGCVYTHIFMHGTVKTVKKVVFYFQMFLIYMDVNKNVCGYLEL